MDNSLGKLVVSLGLDAAEFVAGLTKAEFEAAKFKKQLESGIAAAGRVGAIGISLITTAAIGAAVAVDSLVKEAARFKDLEEITGASAESLASFAVSAKVAGTDMNTVASASVKLTKNLTGVDDESKAAGAALKALGIPIKEFKQLDPATQFDVVAKALAGFQDGTAKTAVALALFGKTGAELLPFLKELGTETGRQTILTQAQIEAADKYADAQAKATAQLQLYLQVAATQALKAIVPFTDAVKDLVKELVGLEKEADSLRDSTAIEDFATNAVRALGFIVDSGQGLGRVFQIVAQTIAAGAAQTAAVAQGQLGRAVEIGRDWSRVVDEILNKQLFSAQLNAKIKAAQDNEKFDGEQNPRRRLPPALKFDGPKPGGSAAAKERTSEAERFLLSLQKQLDKTQELGEVEKALAEIQSGRLKGLTPELQKQILFTAGMIDIERQLKVEIEAGAKAQEELARQQAKAAEERQRETKSAFDQAVAIKEANDALRDEIAVTLGGEEARKALAQAHLDSAIAKQQDALASVLLTKGEGDEAQFIRAQIALLKERKDLLVSKDIADNIKAEMDALKAFSESLANDLGSAIADVVTGTKSFKDAFNDLARSITKNLADIAAKSLANSLFGNKAGGGDIFDVILKLLAASQGGGATGGLGLGGAANGTNFAFGGPTVVGERGREIVDLPRGSRVTPNHAIPQGGAKIYNITISTPVMPGASTASARQTAAMVRDAVQRAVRDR